MFLLGMRNMKSYEVKYEFYSNIGKTISMLTTEEADSAERAKSMGYTKALRSKPSKWKIRFMYVRELTIGSASNFV
jgi:hypothetical protein